MVILKIGTKVQIIGKSVGNSNTRFRTGYILSITNTPNSYGRKYYSVNSSKFSRGGDHYLECDLLPLNIFDIDFFTDKDFEI